MGTYLGLLQRRHADTLIQRLHAAGYRVWGPVVQDDTIRYAPVDGFHRLPTGWVEQQAPGRYRLQRRDSPRCFSWTLGPQGLKPLTFAPEEPLWTVERRHGHDLEFHSHLPEATKRAVLGVRACDLAALALQDRHFLGGPHPDERYRRRREGLFLIAVHCHRAAPTCFCASTGDGPRAHHGFDLALSELDEGYLVEAGSEAGRALAATLPLIPPQPGQQARAEREIRQAGENQERRLPGRDLMAALRARRDAPHWEEMGQRCLACGNCTSVCPTCFCHRHEEHPHPVEDRSTHQRQWDSCFTSGHSYIHGIVIREDTALRYRQWLGHKLGEWHAQYGRSGCVGCGRCITWCPVGIDLTHETAALLAAPPDDSEARDA